MVLIYVEEEKKYVLISGFRGVCIQNAEEFIKSAGAENQPNDMVQFFNADLIATWEHLYYAVINALLANQSKRNITKTLAMETMIYASAQRQIRKAIALLGVKQSSPNVAITIIGDSPDTVAKAFAEIKNHVGSPEDETVLELTKEKEQNLAEVFGITKVELESVNASNSNPQSIVSLIIERMALMQTQL